MNLVRRKRASANARPRSLRRELLASLISVAVALFGAIDLIGHPARTVQVLTIFVGGVGAGVGLGRALDRWRAERRALTAPPASELTTGGEEHP